MPRVESSVRLRVHQISAQRGEYEIYGLNGLAYMVRQEGDQWSIKNGAHRRIDPAGEIGRHVIEVIERHQNRQPPVTIDRRSNCSRF